MNIKNIQQNIISNELFSFVRPVHNQPLDSSNLSLQASITQDEKLVLLPVLTSFSTALLISSISSCGNLIPFVADLLFLCPVAIETSLLNCLYTLSENANKKSLTCLYTMFIMGVQTLLRSV